MLHPRLLTACLLLASIALPTWAQENPPITVLGQTADVIALARVQGIPAAGGIATPSITVQLSVIQYLKGQAPSLSIVAGIPARAQRNLSPMTMPPSTLGSAGIWFLKYAAGTYQILPRDTIAYRYAADLYLPLADTSSPAGATTLDDELLAYVVRWYQSLATPNLRDNFALLSSLELRGSQGITPKQVLSAAAPLLQSSAMSQQLAGLTAALRAGSISAMQTVMANMQTLSSVPQFLDVVMAIGSYPKDTSWIPILQQLAEMHTTVQGMDAAAVGALAKIGTKAVLPVMAELLDSKDPAAQIAASSYFAKFTLLANADGEILDSAPNGPFWTPQAKAFVPGPKPSMTADQYASFWKAWWAQNSAVLGFAAQ